MVLAGVCFGFVVTSPMDSCIQDVSKEVNHFVCVVFCIPLLTEVVQWFFWRHIAYDVTVFNFPDV